ncbi:putative nuclease HARBI1 [Dendropsophus ebraccatus]|uniref:putative nuclease HARBI1 n=1 Tax=Dendropsophus ebraccatus TaxID=150705 RepID=UPI0038320A40
MSEASFLRLLRMVETRIVKEDTVMRRAITVEERLLATLRYLATGRSIQDMKFSTGISAAALCYIIPETCEAIVDALKGEYLKCPETTEEWLQVSEEFDKKWQFPNCGGAMDGKHVRIMQPAKSGSFYFNYKNFFSIILFALVNANYEFLLVDVGRNGRLSDGGVFDRSRLAYLLRSNALAIPSNDQTKANMNFVFLADDAFPLGPHVMKPYPQRLLTDERRIYNYCLSRGRRVVENAFGIMGNRFRILHSPINLQPWKIDSVILACCVLHNFLRKNDTVSYTPPTIFDVENPETLQVTLGDWRVHEVSYEKPPILPLDCSRDF